MGKGLHFILHFQFIMMRKRKSKKNLPVIFNKGIGFVKGIEMKKKVLVADDDPGIRDIFKIILERAGYKTQIMEDAADIYKNNFTIPDVFLIDRLLSGIDGSDVCRFLKSHPLTNKISVIMISASPDIGPISVKAGADDFIEKPFDVNYLLEVLERNIARTKAARRLKRAGSTR
jgi:FixJ family two-component response regulator